MTLHSLTKNGHDDFILNNFYGASGYEVEGDDDVALVHEGVARGSVGRLELHGKSPE
jgi:hypothetical protein